MLNILPLTLRINLELFAVIHILMEKSPQLAFSSDIGLQIRHGEYDIRRYTQDGIVQMFFEVIRERQFRNSQCFRTTIGRFVFGAVIVALKRIGIVVYRFYGDFFGFRCLQWVSETFNWLGYCFFCLWGLVILMFNNVLY